MAICPKCGAQVNDGVNFCPVCGAQMNVQQAPAQPQAPVQQEAAPQQQYAAPQQAPYQAPYEQQYAAPQQAAPSATDHTAEIHPQDIIDNKVLAVLSYFGILVLVPIFAAKNSKFARFHANQGLVLAISEIIFGVLQGIIVGILAATLNKSLYGYVYYTSPVVSIVSTILSLVWLAFSVFAIMGIVYAATGKAKELPLIGKIKILK